MHEDYFINDIFRVSSTIERMDEKQQNLNKIFYKSIIICVIVFSSIL